MPVNEALLSEQSRSLVGLPPVLRHGLTGVAVIAGISLLSTVALFIHLTFKLVTWHVRARKSHNAQKRMHSPTAVDLSLGLSQRYFRGGKARHAEEGGAPKDNGQVKIVKPEPNQFVVLLYNLLLADIHQGMAFFLNSVWVGNDSIMVGTTTCWAQGWFVSTGDLAASCFITAIAIHTYCIIVRGWKPPQWAVIATCVFLWAFVYILAIIGVGITGDGGKIGGYYVRAAAWCWVNKEYDTLRLVLHYLYIFISLALTSLLYTLIFFTLRRRTQEADRGRPGDVGATSGKRSLDLRSTTTTTTNSAAKPAGSGATKAKLNGHHPAFLVYPIIYVFCTLPLALGRIATMAGADVPLAYFCVAGALIVSNGWADVLLWGLTRRSVIFGHIDDDDLGIETFEFMRTPARRFGNMIWVEGAGSAAAAGKGKPGGGGMGEESGFWERLLKGPKGWRELAGSQSGRNSHVHGHRRTGERSISQESLRGAAQNDRGMAIQMDLVTTVVVEMDHDVKNVRTRDASAHSTGSESRMGI